MTTQVQVSKQNAYQISGVTLNWIGVSKTNVYVVLVPGNETPVATGAQGHVHSQITYRVRL